MSPDVLLRVDAVDFSYGSVQVLFGTSLEVGHGEALALLGTNVARIADWFEASAARRR